MLNMIRGRIDIRSALLLFFLPLRVQSYSSIDRESNSKGFSNLPLKHPVRRVYGPENNHARREIALVEDRTFRKFEGHDHVIYYKNHPYDKSTRKLQEHSQQTNTTDPFRPLRIHFYTGALDSQRTDDTRAKIDFIKSEILPQTADFWSNALSVVPIDGKLLIKSNQLDDGNFCGDSEFSKVPSSHISTGVAGTDLILYVSGTPSTRFCSRNTLAVAVACNLDQFDRPIAGAINFCLDQITLDSDGSASEEIISGNVDVAIHEAAHVLGMSGNSFRFFWDPETGAPRTPQPFGTTRVTCVDGVERTLQLPAENTMKFFHAENEQSFASIVTPKVRAVARNQFNCQSLAGAQLENQPTGAGSCTGDHWDERMFYTEAMSGIISVTTNVLSHLTLALMEDSGWYKANYTMGKIDPFGLGAGCQFVNDKCLIPKAEGGMPTIPDYSRGYFCNEDAQIGCSAALSHKLGCSITDFAGIWPKTLPSKQFQYFSDSPAAGGPRQTDYCPVFGHKIGGFDVDQLACSNENNVDSVNLYSEVYAEDSKCFETSYPSNGASCYKAACIKAEMLLKVRIRGEWLTCQYDFEVLDVRVGAGAIPLKVTCPRLAQACPNLFCPFNCAGRGVCNYAHTINGTIKPKCECWDKSDTSSGCSDSLIPDGGFLEDSSGLFDNIEEGFFDPLVSVFVDHPDKWTTAAWAWVAGLLSMLLLIILCICSSSWQPDWRKQVDASSPGERGALCDV